MTDLVIAGTGDSRYLKSVSNFLTLYPTYEDFVDALVAGTLPVDFNGLNVDGVTTVGTAGSKANILPNTTATLLGLDPGDDPKIKDAFNALAVLSSASAPTTSTAGAVKQFYLETTSPQLYQCTAESGGVYTWVAIGGGQYKKIMDVADASATGSVAVSLSGIDFANYLDVQIIGEAANSSASGDVIRFRINNASSGYKRTYMGLTNSLAYSDSATETITLNGVGSSVFGIFKMSLRLINGIVRINYDAYNQYSGGVINGIATLSAASITSLNIVAQTSSNTIYLRNCSIWGMQK